MADGSGDAALAAIVERHGAAVRQRELQFALTLLAGHTSGDTAVHLVRQPVFACYGFESQHILQIFIHLAVIIGCHLIFPFYGDILHNRLRAGAEHLLYRQVEGSHAVGLFEGEAMVARGLADGVHRCALAVGNALHVFDGFLVNEESHALLAFIGNDFLRAQRFVADGQLVHMNQSATLLDEFAQAVHVSGTAVVVDGDDGVFVFFAECAYDVVRALLHFRIGALHGVQFNAAAVASRLDGTYRAAAQADAVVLATHDDHLVARLRLALEAVTLRTISYTACKHDDLIVGIAFASSHLVVLKCQDRTADKGLSELVAEVGGTV